MPKLDTALPADNYPVNPLIQPLWEKKKHSPQETALRFITGLADEDVSEWTWNQFICGIHTTMGDLRDAGITAGDRVLLLRSASAEFLLNFWALIGLGAQPVTVPLTPEAPLAAGLPLLLQIIESCHAVGIVTTPERAAELTEITPQNAALQGLTAFTAPVTKPDTTIAAAVPDSLDDFGLAPVGVDSPVYIQYSSGSTGTPKGVVNHYGCLINQVNLMVDVWNSDANPNSLCWLPLNHSMCIVWGVFDILCTGGTAGFIPTAVFAKNPTIWVEAMSRYQCGMTAAPDTMWRTICSFYQDPNRRSHLDFSHLRIAVDGSEPVNPRTLDLLQSTFGETGWRPDTLNPMYGLAEAGLAVAGHPGPREPVCVYFDVHQAARGIIEYVTPQADDPTQRRLYAVGDESFHLTPRIVDPETREELPVNTVGEIWFEGVVAQQYLNNDQLSAETFDAYTIAGDGPCLRTGDMGFRDDHHNLYISGRMSNKIIVGGENYFPSDIEEIVLDTKLGFAAGQVCAIQPSLDSDWFIVIADAVDVDPLDRDAYSGLISRAISRALGKQPTRVLWWEDALPQTSTGKIARKQVAELITERLAAADNAGTTAGGGAAAADDARADCQTTADDDVHPLLAVVADKLNSSPEKLDRTADVTSLGLTSLAFNEILVWTAGQQCPIDPAAAWENPTIDGWIALYDAATRAAKTAGDPAASAGSIAGDLSDTSPTELQKSYLVGADPKQPWGGIECLTYSEFELADTTVEAVQQAINLVDQEPALHTALPTSDTTVYFDRPAPQVQVNDLSNLSVAAADAAVEKLRQTAIHRSFETAHGENWAVELSHLPSGKQRLHLTLSLICADIVGVGEILQRLDAALRGDEEAAFPTHARHQHTGKAAAVNAGSTVADHASRAKAVATRPAKPLPLPSDIPLRETGEGANSNTHPDITRFAHTFTAKQWQTLAKNAQKIGTTPAGLALASYDAVLRRWSGRDNFLVTLTTINAPEPQQVAERTVAVAHRALVDLGAPWDTTLAHVRNDLRESIAHPVPLTDELRAALASSTGHTGLSPYIFTYAADQPLLEAQQLTALGEPVDVRSATPQVLIDCQLVNMTGAITVSWDVRTDGIRADVAQQMFDTLVQVLTEHTSWLSSAALRQLTARPVISLLPLPHKTQQQRSTSNSTAPVTTDGLLYEPFRQQVKKQPKQVALVWDPQDQPRDKKLGDPLGYNRGYLTYLELDCMARRLAATLEQLTEPNEVVGIQLPKGPCQIIAALAILYAGCTYLPVNVTQPSDRLQKIKDSAKMRIILQRGDLASMVADELGGKPFPKNARALPRRVDASELAYIIYTSGSTGAPKGVAIRHYSALNTCLDVNARNKVTNDDRVLAISALEFDLSVYDIFGMLSAGGTVVCIGDDARRDAFRWAEMVQRFHVTIWDTVPGLGEMLYAAAQGSVLPSLRRFYFSGDWIALDLPKRLKTIAPNATCISMGGATEGSIWSNEHVVENVEFPEEWKSIPYGGPLTGQKYRVVNPYVPGFFDQPDYVPGELWIGGAGVAAGYFGQPDLTAERYPVDDNGDAWYRTGDLGEYHTDGLIFFVGRMDTQVKIRGHRVECGEVEHACRALTGVDTAIVVPIRKNSALGAVLVASGAAAAEIADNPERLRDQLATKLPDYMVPAVIMPRRNLPHTPNGKIDRKLLAQELESYQHQQASGKKASSGSQPSTVIPFANLDQVAQLVVSVWADVLGEQPETLAQQMGNTAVDAEPVNFFALGGDSLAATTVCTKLAQQGCQVTVADLFAAPTLEAFLSRARGAFTGSAAGDSAGGDGVTKVAAGTGAIVSASTPDLLGETTFPFTSLQQAYALGADGIKGITCTTPAVGVILTSRDGSNLDPARFATIIAQLTQEWEALRCVRSGDAEQTVANPARVPTTATIRTLPAASTPEAARTAIRDELSGQRIPLDSIPVMNVVNVDDCGQYIGLSMNYLGLDARSIGVFLNTILDRYEGTADTFTINPSARPFYDYVQEEIGGAGDGAARTFALPEAPSLPTTDKAWTAASDAAFTALEQRLTAADTQKLQKAVAAAGVTLSAVVLHAYGAVIAAGSGLDECGISVPMSQRPSDATAQAGTEEVLGNFTELALITLGATTSVQDVHNALGHLTDKTLPTSRDIARAGRAAYPVVFTSTTGVAALRRSGTVTPDWILTRTPGVQLDCQVMVDGDTGELSLRWDSPAEYVHQHRLERLFDQFVQQVKQFATAAATAAPAAEVALETELDNLTRELSHAAPPPPREIMAAALEHLAKHAAGTQHTPSPTPLPEYSPVLDLWRTRSVGVTPTEAARRTGTWLADAVCGGFDVEDIVGHPVLSPQALLLQESAVPGIIDTIVDVTTRKYEQLGRPVSVIELGSGIGLVKETITRRLDEVNIQFNWQSVERDQRWRASATKRDEISLEKLSGIPADVVVAVASLHRDPRLLRDLATVPTLTDAELVVAEATELTDAALISAVVVEPTLLDATDYLQNAGQWWMQVTDAEWQPYAMSTPSPYICVVQGRRTVATAPEKCPIAGASAEAGVVGAGAGAGVAAGAADPAIRAAAGTILQIWQRVLPEAADLNLEVVDTWQADFFALGGDSLAATQVLQELKEQGYQELRLVDLFNTSELSEFAELVAGLTPTDAGEADAADAATSASADAPAANSADSAETHPVTHPLTGVQQAYLAGRSDAHILGGVASHCYYEFTTTDLNRKAFAEAIHIVVDAHDELRALIVDGVAEVQPTTPDHVVTTVADPRGETEHEAPDPSQQVGMVVRLSEPAASADAAMTISVGMDNLILDGASMMLILQEIDRTYLELAAGHEPTLRREEISFGGYLRTHQDALLLEDITDPATAQQVQKARDYWTTTVATLPPAPQIAERKTVLAIREPQVDRVSADVPAEVWTASQEAARAQRITPASLLLGAYAQSLAEWTFSHEFTINVTLFDRDLSVPGIAQVVGDFTSLSPVACTARTDESLAEVCRTAQQNLATVREYDSAGALWVQRELLQLTGDPYKAMLPVVYTCGLGLIEEGVSGTNFSFGTMQRVRSQTPQTLLDMQVHEDVDGLHITADYVTQAVDAAAVQQAIDGVAQRVTAFAAGAGHVSAGVDGAATAAAGVGTDLTAGTAFGAGVAGHATTTAADVAVDTAADADTHELYHQIATVWEAALEGVALTPDSNFFMEGGDSLRATTVTRQVQDATGRDVDLRILLTNPTLSDYVQAVADVPCTPVTAAALTPADDTADDTLVFADSDLEEGTL